MRLLGYDTVVFPEEAGREMLRLAAAEEQNCSYQKKRYDRAPIFRRLFLITDIDVGNQLNDVIEKFSLKIDRQKMFGICLECNEKLNPVDREDVRDLVPPFVFENCTEYNQCPRCLKIYWTGTHQRNALRFMEKHIPNHLP